MTEYADAFQRLADASNIVEMKSKKLFVECDCYSEGIMFEKWPEEDEVYVSIWQRGIKPFKMTWGYRLRYIWRILRGKSLYSDEVVLSNKKVNQIVDWLHNLS